MITLTIKKIGEEQNTISIDENDLIAGEKSDGEGKLVFKWESNQFANDGISSIFLKGVYMHTILR